MSNYQPLVSLNLQNGLNLSAPRLSQESEITLGDGSWNSIVSGDGFTRPFSGMTTQGAGTGSLIMCPFGNTWGGIKSFQYADKTFTAPADVATDQVTVTGATDYVTGIPCTVSTGGTLPTGLLAATVYYIIVVNSTTIAFASSVENALLGVKVPITASTGSGTITIDVSNAAVTASGSWMQDIGLSRWGIGAGQPHIEGTSVPGFQLTTNLQVQIRTGGVFGAPVQAGLSQPSVPDIGIVNIAGVYNASMSAKIARSRPSTGAVSVASETSDVVFPQGNRIRITFPLAQTGQTHWRVYFPFQGFGGVGVHYLAPYNGDADIAETTVNASTVDGIPRTLEFNLLDGNLIPIAASFDDYPPPAATHAIRLNTVMNLVGCYSDATQGPTTSNPGTCIAVSKENNYESYVPTSLLYLPEQVVDVMARPLDDYGYVGCQNSIHAIQYVGDRGEDLPSCTITTVLPDIGIQNAWNWAYFRGQLLIYTAQGSLLLMDNDGSFSTSFANPVAKLLRSWTPATTVVGYDPKNDSIVVGNGNMLLVYSLQRGQWRQIWLPDYGLTGTVVSMTTAKRELYITLTSSGVLTAYTYDTATGFVQQSFVTNYRNSGGVVVHDIYELAVAAEVDTSSPLVAAINTDLSPTAYRRLAISSGSPTVTSTTLRFNAGQIGKQIVLFGTDIGGSGIHYFQSTIIDVPTQLTATMAANAPSSGSLLLGFVADWVGVKTLTEAQHLSNFFPNLAEVRSFQFAAWLRSRNDVGNVLTCDVLGASYASSRALTS